MPSANVSWPVPLQRLTPWYPGQMGVPGTDSDRGLRQDANGKIIWVDPNHVDANDQKDGTDPESPMRTVAAALTKCRAYSGDVIAVMNNSLWTYGNPAVGRATPILEAVTVTTPGIRIVGVAPSGTLGVPWLPPLANATCITVHAMDVLVEGFNFWMTGALVGTIGVAADWGGAPPVYGENLTVRHCHFYNLAYGVQLDWTYYCRIEDCYFNGMTTWAIYNASVHGDPDYTTVRDNFFVDNTGAIDLPAATRSDIQHNKFMNNDVAISLVNGTYNIVHSNVIMEDPTGALNYIDTSGGGGSMVSDNWLGCTLAQYPVTCDSTVTDMWVRNHCQDGESAANP